MLKKCALLKALEQTGEQNQEGDKGGERQVGTDCKMVSDVGQQHSYESVHSKHLYLEKNRMGVCLVYPLGSIRTRTITVLKMVHSAKTSVSTCF